MQLEIDLPQIPAGIVSRIGQDDLFLGVALHGSHSRHNADEYSDTDLIAFVEPANLQQAGTRLRDHVSAVCPIVFHHETHRFPWFGWLHYFVVECGSQEVTCLDVGIVAADRVDTFFVEPTATILKDFQERLAMRKAETKSQVCGENIQRLLDADYEILNLVLKFEKAIQRGHYWSAQNHCAVARRLLFTYQRIERMGLEAAFVGLSDRRIESELSIECLSIVCESAAPYEQAAICIAFRKIMSALLDMREPRLKTSTLSFLQKHLERLDEIYQMDKPKSAV